MPASIKLFGVHVATKRCNRVYSIQHVAELTLEINLVSMYNSSYYNMWFRVSNYWNDAAGLLESISIVVRHSETSVDFFVDGLKKIGTLIPVPQYSKRNKNFIGKSFYEIYDRYENLIQDFHLWAGSLSDLDLTCNILNKKTKAGLGANLLLASRSSYFIDTRPKYLSGSPQGYFLPNIASGGNAQQSDGSNDAYFVIDRLVLLMHFKHRMAPG